MKQLFELVELETNDGIRHQGVFAAPKKRASTGIIWIHGLTGAFWHSVNRTNVLAEAFIQNGYAFGFFNNRGHDYVDEEVAKNGKPFFIGGGFEKFTDCVQDIDAMITYMRRRGCKKVILIGHSTGANKVAYYSTRKKNPAVKGIILLSGLSDVLPLTKKRKKDLQQVTALAKKNPTAVLPYEKFGVFMNAQRYVSLRTPGSVEDVFPHHGYAASWATLAKLKTPAMVIIGSKDQHLNVSAKKYIHLVTSHMISATVTAKIIAGANHGYKGKEKELAKSIITFVQKL